MGLDFSYQLYFPHHSLWNVLLDVAVIAEKEEEQVLVHFPEQDSILPFKTWAGTGNPLDYQDERPQWNFMTTLNFDVDSALLAYLNRHGDIPSLQEGGQQHAPEDEITSAAIGYIYLTVHKGTDVPRAGYPYDDLIMLQFAAATTRMGLLFAGSQSIRMAFVRLLENHHGICGLLDREDDAEVFWWKGEEREETIPLPWMPLSHIEYYLQTGELPF